MNTFVHAVDNQLTTTENGMPAFVSTTNASVDFFFKSGASRGKNIIPTFIASFVEDQDLAVRIALWLRDVRQGSGERKLFRDILQYLEVNAPEVCKKILPKIPELGRWDDLLVFQTETLRNAAFGMIGQALEEGIKAKQILSQIDKMSEEECEKLLKEYV
jgi:hypothetical protein